MPYATVSRFPEHVGVRGRDGPKVVSTVQVKRSICRSGLGNWKVRCELGCDGKDIDVGGGFLPRRTSKLLQYKAEVDKQIPRKPGGVVDPGS
jgi:hypothetical protein